MSTLTELEDRLLIDPLGQTRRTLLDALAEAASDFNQQQRDTPSADVFARLERQRQSCLAAMEVIDRAWLLHDDARSAHLR
ncbi:EscE/YscE/SsaE family type III secretion system needle protein co-chaperone [Dyella sp. M7H15-1]|uniref:EscE/YscE/SsaE family type III secretion system needle protein co-chaperone n=1 Tax=Dyella sp. M7H15-1 TaxID=2501295 RepID=UPI001004EB99|nr:EscE/YscE/SsaE family type III secretion system needle protein co-chaperone [Dyella sp. M7H15-1]QAU24833.1 EscE/YscE/SsaE family type III secretion system needle protein co-chaperone [Dyella sp. M7H15-1]